MLEAFLSRGISLTTQKSYRSVLTNFLDHLEDKKLAIDCISPQDVYDYIKACKKTTGNKIISIVKTYYKYVTKLDLMVEARAVNSFRKDRNLPINDVRKLIKHAPTARDRLLMRALFMTGLRVTEIASIKKENITIENGYYYLYYIAKGNKDRKIRLQNGIARDLLKYESGKDTIMGIGARQIERIIATLSKNILGRVVTPHCFRHGFATELMNQGVSFKRIQEELGHQNIETTLRYLHNGDLRGTWYIDL